MRLRLGFVLLISVVGLHAQPQPKPIKRPADLGLDSVLEQAPPREEPPAAITGIAERLVFHVSPLSAKGLLSQQVRDAIKALDKANGNATILKLRAFVAGTGDMRRVQAIVVEEFEAKKWPLPVITTVQIGALPLEGAQVVLESVSQERSKSVNPGGLAFVGAHESQQGGEAVSRLAAALKSSSAEAVTVACFAHSAEELSATKAAAERTFRGVPLVMAQATRYHLAAPTMCEAVGRFPKAPIREAKLVFSSAQLGTGEQEQLVYDRLRKVLDGQGAGVKVLAARRYGIQPAAPPELGTAKVSLMVEGLPSLDATMAIEAIAAVD